MLSHFMRGGGSVALRVRGSESPASSSSDSRDDKKAVGGGKTESGDADVAAADAEVVVDVDDDDGEEKEEEEERNDAGEVGGAVGRFALGPSADAKGIDAEEDEFENAEESPLYSPPSLSASETDLE